MNKLLSGFIQGNNLTYDPKEKLFYGTANGVQISGCFSSFGGGSLLSFHARIPEARQGEVAQYLAGVKKTYGFADFNMSGDGVVCSFAAVGAKKYVACADELSKYLSGLGANANCPFCGEELGEGARLVGSANGVYRAHEKCFDEYVEQVRGQEIAQKAAPANLGKAIGGMVLGVLVGCVAWVVFFALGLISFWAPLISGFLGAFLWDKFGGKNDKVKIICIWVVTIVLLTLTLFLCYYVAIQNEINAEALDINVFEAFEILMETNSEFKSGFFTNIVVSYVFILAADAVVTVQIAKTQKLMSKTFRKL